MIIATASESYDAHRRFYEERYLHGDCYYFAVALYRTLGWKMFAILDSQGESFHAFVRSPEGQPYDVRGPIQEEELASIFDISGPHRIVPTNEDMLRKAMADIGRKFHEIGIGMAIEAAQFLFPSLPWPEATFADRVREFASELEFLSLKYGLWIRGPYPAQPAVISGACGEEDGYEVAFLGPEDFSINRKLK